MKDRMSVDPKIHFAKPCVTGTRIPVQNVLELVREETTFSHIIADYYPDLTVEDIRACIQFVIDTLSLEEIHSAQPTP